MKPYSKVKRANSPISPGTRVVVTGGAGFIGSELVYQLATQGADVIVVDNLINSRRENLEQSFKYGAELVVADIRDKNRMEDLIRGVDAIFNLACLGVRHSIHSPLENHEVNSTATLSLLMIARKAGIKRFVHVSSSEVYGTAIHVPMTEDHPTLPMTVYGASKLAGESYARAFHRTYGFPVVIVRPFNTYGQHCHHEGDSGEVIPKFLLRCMAGRQMVIFGDGTQIRDFIHVSDTARGILLAGLAEDAIGQTINIGSGDEITINSLAREVMAVTGRQDIPVVYDMPRPGDTLRLCAEIGKANHILGFQPKVTLREGLESLKKWYLSLGQPPEVLLEREVVRNWESGGLDANGA